MRIDNANEMVFDRVDTFRSTDGRSLQLDIFNKRDGNIPLLMTLGSLSRNAYIAFDSTLAMLRSICAAQDAGVLKYVENVQNSINSNGTSRELNELYYDVEVLWEVLRPLNLKADYWPALIDGSLEWDEFEVLLPENGILNLDPRVHKLIVGIPEDYLMDEEEHEGSAEEKRSKK